MPRDVENALEDSEEFGICDTLWVSLIPARIGDALAPRDLVENGCDRVDPHQLGHHTVVLAKALDLREP